ncbi:MAG: hypothetical protein DRR03_08210 [Gammaproteobacteria bacterium]|nr:MAG: hypothetical protein DRR03_08210 [Gammaproteobacteria bacterium]
MKSLSFPVSILVSGVTFAHHSPDHVTEAVASAAPPEGLGHLWWVIGPFVLLAIVGVVRALRRHRVKR